MKKIISIMLAVVMTLALASVAFAAETGSQTKLDCSSENKTATKDVKVITKDAADEPLDPEDPGQDDPTDPTPGKVYSVDVTFDSLEYTYKYTTLKAEDVTYNTETHIYTYKDGDVDKKLSTAAGEWNKTVQNIKVTNHSNAKVYTKAAFPNGAAATKYGVTATLAAAGETSIESAEGETTAPSITYTVTVSGAPDVLKTFVVDTVTVTISKAAFPA